MLDGGGRLNLLPAPVFESSLANRAKRIGGYMLHVFIPPMGHIAVSGSSVITIRKITWGKVPG